MPIGTGMCALANILKDMGYEVLGSDCDEIFFTDDILKKNEIQILKFNKENISKEYIYIISSCYDEENIEVNWIVKNNYKYYYYHEFIQMFFNKKIGVSGVHGKSTTTAILTDLLKDKKISSLVGDGTGIGINDYEHFIFEACEYKNHILSYTFDYLIITNIDLDHLDFFKNIDEVYETFKIATKKSNCIVVNENIDIDHKNKYTFGKRKDSFCYYEIIEESEKGYKLKINIDKKELSLDFPYFGEHMIYNFMAAFTLYYILYKDLIDIQNKVYNFRKINRRMNEYIYNGNIIIDDYAHHPTEITALLKGIKQKYKNKKIIIIFQPHTYSRTLKLIDQFNESFKLSDKLYLMNTFTSKREKYDGKLENKVFEMILNKEKFDEEVLKELLNNKNNQVIVFLGAGNFVNYIKKLGV